MIVIFGWKAPIPRIWPRCFAARCSRSIWCCRRTARRPTTAREIKSRSTLRSLRVLTHFFIVDPQFCGIEGHWKITSPPWRAERIRCKRPAMPSAIWPYWMRNSPHSSTESNRPPPNLPSNPANDSGGAPRTLSAAEFEARRADFESLRGRADDAQGDLEEAITNDPSLAEAEQCLGFLLLKKNNLDDAEKHFDRAVQLDPKDALNFYGSGLVALAKAANPAAAPGAAAAFEKAAALNPDFAPTWFNLALIYSQRDETLQKALTDARRAASLTPGRIQLSIAACRRSRTA